MELVISRPGSTGDRYITARVSDTTSGMIVVADVGGAYAPVYAALNAQTQGFVVYDFHTGDNTTGGNWTDDPDYVPFLTVTRFTDENADFQSYMVGWTLIADVEKPSFLTIVAVPTATRVEVFGDATGLSADGKTYRLVAPPGVDPTTGALSKPNTVLSKRADNRGCAWLWSGYQYVPPQVGHESGGSTTGAQGGINKLGTYYCWNRTYDLFMGRWTTPDPASSPIERLFEYPDGTPTGETDGSGLGTKPARPMPPPTKVPPIRQTNSFSKSYTSDALGNRGLRGIEFNHPKDGLVYALKGFELGQKTRSHTDGKGCLVWTAIEDWDDDTKELVSQTITLASHNFKIDISGQSQYAPLFALLTPLPFDHTAMVRAIMAEVASFRSDELDRRVERVTLHGKIELEYYTLTFSGDVRFHWATYRQCPCEDIEKLAAWTEEKRFVRYQYSDIQVYQDWQVEVTYSYLRKE